MPRETKPGERLVALTPEAVAILINSGFRVSVEARAGEQALLSDEDYVKEGATMVAGTSDLHTDTDMVLRILVPKSGEIELLPVGCALICFLNPAVNIDMVQRLAERGITSFSMDAVPSIARAQSMDALTSMASVAGYKAALIAADTLGIFLPMMVTAAGTMPPAKGLVLGAGVAGLQAMATARSLGAVMYGYDIRPAVEEQVQSLGARFVESEATSSTLETSDGYARESAQNAQARERELLHGTLKEMDFVITTAAVPGRRAPLLITEEMVDDMKAGSVIVDVAAENGGNCEVTRPGETVVHSSVTVYGPLNLPSAMPRHASQMYSRNVSNLLEHLTHDGELRLDFDDEITSSCCITWQSRIVHAPTLDQIAIRSNGRD